MSLGIIFHKQFHEYVTDIIYILYMSDIATSTQLSACFIYESFCKVLTDAITSASIVFIYNVVLAKKKMFQYCKKQKNVFTSL